METICGYRILRELTPVRGRVFEAERGGRRYEIREIPGCRFPTEEGISCPDALRPAQARAERFLQRLCSTVTHLRSRLHADGPVALPEEVFRAGQMICAAVPLPEPCAQRLETLHERLSHTQLAQLLRSLLLQLEALGRIGFVHGDCSPEHLSISRKDDVLTAALTGSETGFAAGRKPAWLDADPLYAAPELIRLRSAMDGSAAPEKCEAAAAAVGCAADMFALGCTFCHILTGSPWTATDGSGRPVPPGRQLLMGVPPQLPEMHAVWRSLLCRMTAPDPASRPSPRAMIDVVNACISGGLFGELADPWADFDVLAEFSGNADARIVQHHGRRTLMRHAADLWQLPRPFLWRPGGAQQLRCAHSHALKRLERLEKRVRPLAGMCGILRAFDVIRRGRRVFVAIPLPVGTLHPLSALFHLTSPEEEAALLTGLLEDMQRLHEAGLLHGALDGDSIAVLIPEGGRPQLLLTDPHRLHTRQEISRGFLSDTSPGLLAPEMAETLTAANAEERRAALSRLGPAADVFSLGLLAHEILTGEMPRMAADGCLTLAMASQRQAIVLAESLPPHQKMLLRRMLAPDPAERLKSCGEAARLLNAALPAEAHAASAVPVAESPVCFVQELPEAFLDAGAALLLRPAAPAMICELPEVFVDGGDALLCKLPAGGAELSAPEEALHIADLDEDYSVSDYGELPSGFLRQPATCREDGRAVLLRPLLPRLSFLAEHAGWFEQRRRDWNRIASAAGLMPVKAIAQHGGVAYGVTPACDEWERLTALNFAACSPWLAHKWISDLLRQLRELHRRGLRCPLISPGEVAFLAQRAPMHVRLHGFDHFQRPEHPQDEQLWLQQLQDRHYEEECRSWAADQPMAYLAPEACENVFCGAGHPLTPATDLFGVGVLLHVMLTGRHPVRGGRNWRDAYAREKVMIDGKIPFAFRCLIMKLLAEDPAERPADCDEVLAWLERIAGEEKKVRTVTVRRDGVPLAGSTAELYAVGRGAEHYVASARVGTGGRAAFKGCMPAGFAYEVRCGAHRQTCRWRLT